MTRALDQTLTERIDFAKIGAHPFHHDLAVDIDHVTVTNMTLVHHVAHLHARWELAWLTLRAKNRHLRLREIVENILRHRCERARRVIFQNQDRMFGTDCFDFKSQCSCDVTGRFVGNDRDSLIRR